MQGGSSASTIQTEDLPVKKARIENIGKIKNKKLT